MTITLLTDSQGKKMGKTAGNAVWLDPNKTSPFAFYQYWRNVDDADVMKCIRMLTFLPLETIRDMDGWPDSRINEKKEILAFELTSLVHGQAEAEKAQSAARALFSGEGDDAEMPTTCLCCDQVPEEGVDILTLLVCCGLAKSKGDARQLVQKDKCISVNGEKVTDTYFSLTREQLCAGVKIKKGKKIFHKAILEK